MLRRFSTSFGTSSSSFCQNSRRWFSAVATSSSSSSFCSDSLDGDDQQPSLPHRELQQVALDELRKEIERDRDENAIGNAPLPPKGWSVAHSSGSSTFQLKTRLAFRNSSKGSKRKRPPAAGSNRWNAAVNISCRFEAVDPSFHDSGVDLCEYVPFRVVIVRREEEEENFQRPSSSSSSSSSSMSLIADCASVNSQLRLRRVFFAPHQVPDQEAPGAIMDDSTASAATSSMTTMEKEASVGFPHSVFMGPQLGSLSKELKQTTMEFLSGCGVDDRMAEFVCQMAYYLEHQEYQLWLARLGRFAESSSPQS